MQADNLHREVALLSNTLHQYADADLEGVKPVIEKIVEKREQWRQVMKRIEYYKKTGRKLEDETAKAERPAIDPNGTASDLRVELALLNSNISKTKKKLEINPEHKKAQHWSEELAKMEALKMELRNQITQLTYATK